MVGSNDYGQWQFVSLIEHQQYPFYGSAWHHEMNQVEFVVTKYMGNFTHDWSAIQVGQYFANFLVNEARKNRHHFRNKLEESQHLIYNYNEYRIYMGKEEDATFEEVFQFPILFSGIGNYQHQKSVLALTLGYTLIICLRRISHFAIDIS